jgi:hypothetical protein
MMSEFSGDGEKNRELCLPRGGFTPPPLGVGVSPWPLGLGWLLFSPGLFSEVGGLFSKPLGLLELLVLPVLEPVEIVGFFFCFYVVSYCNKRFFRYWPVKNGRCWWIFGGDVFKVRSIILGWFFFNKNLPVAASGLFRSGWSPNETVRFAFVWRVTRTRRGFSYSVFVCVGYSLLLRSWKVSIYVSKGCPL